MTITEIAALVSLVFSGIAIWVSVRTARKQQRSQERMATIEETRRQEEVEARNLADVTAVLEDRLTSQLKPGKSFVVINRGPAVAEDISIDITAVDEGDVPILVGAEAELRLPRLDAEGRFGWPVMTHSATARAIDVELKWRDGSGSRTNAVRLNAFG